MHVLLYVFDALRADHLGCYGYNRATSPQLDQVARDGVVFENCFTATTWTRPVAASILSGAYPSVHLTRSRYDQFSANLTRLPEVLQAAGFQTAAFSTMGNIASEIGFNRGFGHYADLFRDPPILAKRRRLDAAHEGMLHAPDSDIALPRAEDINTHLLPWLTEQRTANTFSFVWSIETHAPYIPPAEFRRFSGPVQTHPNEGEREDIRAADAADRQRLINLYDDGIYYNDHCFGEIVSELKSLGIYDDTLLILVGDHGDAFYEHGFYGHGRAPYDELIHVPLILKLPNSQHAGQRCPDLVELIDIFPTVTAAAGVTQSADLRFVQGRNLLPSLAGVGGVQRPYVFSDTQSLEIHNHYLSVRSQQWKYIQRHTPKRDVRTFGTIVNYIFKRHLLWDMVRAPVYYLRSYFQGANEYLFDLQADPAEQRNLAVSRPEVVHQLRQVLSHWQQQNTELAQQVSNLPYNYAESEALRQHLEALGYV